MALQNGEVYKQQKPSSKVVATQEWDYQTYNTYKSPATITTMCQIVGTTQQSFMDCVAETQQLYLKVTMCIDHHQWTIHGQIFLPEWIVSTGG